MIVVTPNNTSGASIFGIKFACLTRKYRPHVSFYPRQQIAPIFRLVSCQEAAAAVLGASTQIQFNSSLRLVLDFFGTFASFWLERGANYYMI